ncbi:response regulator transcription factor [Rhodocytophaga rosea]|uniref:Response regulator transcription factor n=1 Tax=Rhodocytophaga rosea TaxID=2704465 RepID=A0A6C0GFP5_9BACT|nr:response regulator transcription factor [Rhodocytophaga rosea]QHT66685.1 response regulator transcription factor [Rhodocytophaga rosea]
MDMPPINVSIYEDNNKLRELLELLVDNTQGLHIVGTYPDCRNIAREIRHTRPDVIIMDIDMQDYNGIEGVRLVKEFDAGIRVLMHTVFDDDDKLFACLSNGADGYLLKKDSSLYLIQAVRDVYAGGGPMSPGIARRVLKTFHQPLRVQENEYHITSREKQILELLARGFTYRMIAIEFSISIETVRRHLKNIYQKLHVQCGPEAVAKAIRAQIIKY